MSGARKVGNFQFYDVNRIVKDGFDAQDMPVFERTDTIYDAYQCKRAVLAQSSHETADAMRSHIILYSPLGIIIPTARNLSLVPGRGARTEFRVLTESVAYGQLKDATPEVNDELNLLDLERLVRSRYDGVIPEGWCTVFIGNRVVPN